MKPLFISFYTVGTLYEREAARLRQTLMDNGLDHIIEGVPDLGSWLLNTRHTATFIGQMMDRYPLRPIVNLDADAYVHSYPSLFDELEGKCDLAAYWRHGSEMLNGTLYLAPCAITRLVIADYAAGIAAHPEHTNEQYWLQEAVRQTRKLRVYRLPPEYCFIFDGGAKELAGKEPVIEHLQASREGRESELLERRKKRVRELENDLRRVSHAG